MTWEAFMSLEQRREGKIISCEFHNSVANITQLLIICQLFLLQLLSLIVSLLLLLSCHLLTSTLYNSSVILLHILHHFFLSFLEFTCSPSSVFAYIKCFGPLKILTFKIQVPWYDMSKYTIPSLHRHIQTVLSFLQLPANLLLKY